jgi:two-component system, cell cycle response regulator DivK
MAESEEKKVEKVEEKKEQQPEPGSPAPQAEPKKASDAEQAPVLAVEGTTPKEEKKEQKSEPSPAPQVEPKKASDAGQVQVLVVEDTASKKEEKKEPQPEPTPALPSKPKKVIDPGQAHVLVVEDNVPNFVLIARMLAYMGVQRCEWKTSGWQVVEFADTLPRIDLILMDIRLPYEDGFQALEKVRSHPRLKETLVVAVTAEASVEQMKRAKESGFDGFLGKPLDPDRFPDQIKRVLNGDPVWEMH